MSSESAQSAPRPIPRPRPRAAPCPYCGAVSEAAVGGRSPAVAAASGAPAGVERCPSCRGLLDPLSRQASQNSMGPWFIRDESNPFRPGCSIETLRRLAARSRIGPETIVRGPTTRQFWMFARNTPGVANLFGECHSCHTRVRAEDVACPACGADFAAPDDRQHLGLGPVHLLPGHASPETIAAASARGGGTASAGGTLMLLLGVGAVLAGLGVLGGAAGAAWVAFRPEGSPESGQAAPAAVAQETSGEGGGASAPVVGQVSVMEDAAKRPSETSDGVAASFEVRWRQLKRISEQL